MATNSAEGNVTSLKLDELCVDGDVSTAQTVAYVIVCALVLLMNAFTIFIIVRNKKMRMTQGFLMLSLAVCDFLLGVIFVVPVIGLHSFPLKCLTPALCKFIGYTGSCLASVSIYMHLLLTMDKYDSIAHPLTYRDYGISTKIVAGIAVTWSVPLCVWLFPLIDIGGEFTFHENQFACYLNFYRFEWISLGYVAVIFGVSSTGMVVLYCKIWRVSQKHREIITRSSSGNPEQGSSSPSNGKRRLRTPLLIVCSFYASWCPLFLTSVIKIFSSVTVAHWCDAIIFMLAMCNSMWNPLIYFFTFRPFQQEVKRFFPCRESRLKPQESSSLQGRSQVQATAQCSVVCSNSDEGR